LDRYLNGDYVRLDEIDYSRRSPLELYPERSQLDLGAPPPPWAFRASRFRGVDGAVALEIAYEVRLQRPVSAILVEATGWRGVGRAAGTVQHTDTDAALVQRSDGRTLGRVRLEIAPPVEALGIELREVGGKVERPWRASERRGIAVETPNPEVLELSDLMPAYSLREGRPSGSRPRDAVVVPRVDSTIAEGRLHVYFEVYPSLDAVARKHALAVTYRVHALPSTWRFRDQFNATALRARAERRIAVESTFEMRARGVTEPQTLSVDLRRVSAGPYLFEVEVRDVETGETARRSLPFEVPKPTVISRAR
jgi:hypothetical protein